MQIKYNPITNYKTLKAMEPNEVDKVLTWVFLILGMFFYEFYPDKEGLTGILGFGLIYKLGMYLGWVIHWFIQAIYCKKHKLNFDGTNKEQKNEY